MNKQIKELIPQQRVLERIAELGEQISREYAGKSITMLILANGGVFFAVDLIRSMKNVAVYMECIRVSSYKKSCVSSGNPEIFGTLSAEDFKDNHILIVDDIVDTGNTLKRLCEQIENFGAASVKVCALLDKPSRRTVDLVPDYRGFEVEDKFIVGYGLDYAEKYRELPFIGYIE